MAARNTRNPNSVETILTFDNRDAQSQWSEVWSTAHIPGMDNASGGAQGGPQGRRKLRLGSLALGTFLTMHCRVTASALTGGFFVFMLFHILATVAHANPLRHFEVYLGQWSISGPGRAFRILPMFEGIGIAVCINALVRAIICCTIAAICAMYVVYSVSDSKLPFTYCRDFDLRPYDPILKEISFVMLRESRFSLVTGDSEESRELNDGVTVGTRDFAWRNASRQKLTKNELKPMKNTRRRNFPHKIEICNESYTIGYPILYSTPAYNFFYVEVVLFREDYNFGHFNMSLVLYLILVWTSLWLLLIWERLTHGRLIWNNMYSWLFVIPWIWVALLVITSLTHFIALPKAMRTVFRVGAKEILAGLADAFEVAIYIHSAGVGTELIHGKGLNHYAAGHIDPHLNGENVWHSGLLLLMSGLHSGGAAVCALVDGVQPNTKTLYDMNENILYLCLSSADSRKSTFLVRLFYLWWAIGFTCASPVPATRPADPSFWSKFLPSFSIAGGTYPVLLLLLCTSAVIFSGLMFSYMTVAYVLVKTALHTIFEYKVKLVFAEQAVVAGLILCCMGISFLFATTGGVALLESVDAIMTGISTPFVCLLELVALLYVYRSHDFVSDMNIATEENACASRIDTQWQIIPIITVVTLIVKLSVLCGSELPGASLSCASAAVLAVLLAVPLRAARNALVFVRARRK